MKIILSPAKKMNVETDILPPSGLPEFLDRTEVILSWLRSKSHEELKALWGCNDKIAEQNYERLEHMDLRKCLTPADRYITITFCEKSGDKLVTKGTYAKMARGEMVRFMAENRIEDPEEIRKFDRLGYLHREELSSDTEYVFERIT
ncbi:MAG: peroxide stress protein YaaA [Lachnospiraceae bacterium]